MSESTGEKTEQPTDKKIRDARKKGQVAKSNDVSSSGILCILFAYFGATREFYLKGCIEIISSPADLYALPFKDALNKHFSNLTYEFLLLILPLLGLVTAVAIGINMIQIGPLLTFETLKPDIKKLNPVEGAKKIFKKQNLVEFLKNIIKTVFLGYLVYRVVKASIQPLLLVPYAGLGGVFEIIIPLLKTFAINVAIAYVIIAVADLFFQRANHTKELMMTKDEVKREFKEMEGDPQIKSERKQLHQEMAMNDTVQSTKKASALVTNPEHYAVAIFYNEEAVDVPVVTAKGKDHIALMMIKVAQEENIPIMRDVNLARSLYSECEAYSYVPSDLIKPVAAVLKWAQEIYHGRRQDM